MLCAHALKLAPTKSLDRDQQSNNSNGIECEKNILLHTKMSQRVREYIEKEIQSEDHFCALDLLNCSPWKILLARQQSALCNVTCHWAFKFIKMFSSHSLLLQLAKSRRRHLARVLSLAWERIVCGRTRDLCGSNKIKTCKSDWRHDSQDQESRKETAKI